MTVQEKGQVAKEAAYRRCCILLSGGVGSRMGTSIPKQYVSISGRTIIEHTLCAIKGWKSMDSILVVADKGWQRDICHIIEQTFSREEVAFLGFASPGENRQASVLSALHEAMPYMAEDAVVMVHDAVRPLVSMELLNRCDAVLSTGDGVMPYLSMRDTVYQTLDGRHITKNLDRDTIIAGQTPEFYSFWKYLRANEAMSMEELLAVHGSTEPAVAAGMQMVLAEGEEQNFKITTKSDLIRFQKIVEEREKILEGVDAI